MVSGACSGVGRRTLGRRHTHLSVSVGSGVGSVITEESAQVWVQALAQVSARVLAQTLARESTLAPLGISLRMGSGTDSGVG